MKWPSLLSSTDLNALYYALDQTALVSITDKRGVITFANDKFVEISKYSREELIGQNHRILKSGHQPDVIFDELWIAISQGHLWRGQLKNRAKDGSYYWVDTSIAPIIGTNGKPERYIAVRFLTTESQELYEKLETKQNDLVESKAKNDAILRSIGEGMVATDKLGRITHINKAFEQLTGWKLSEVRKKKLIDILPLLSDQGELIDSSLDLIFNTLKGGARTLSNSSDVHYIERKDGSLFPVSTTVSAIVHKNQTIGVVKVFRDITHEKQIDKAKSEFVSLASHQLRTPLTAINWYSEMLMANDAGPLNEEQKKYITEIQAGTQRMIDLVNALLNVSRIDLGTFMIEPEPTDLISLCKKIVKESESQIFEKKQKFDEIYPKVLKPINIDPKLTSVVIDNIISNAIKYTPVGGTISLSIKTVNDIVRIIISDNGHGIPLNQQEKIFTKLFRADNVTTHDTEGTGLGLYIAKSVMETSGGKLWFKSVENKGTTFYLEFPKQGMKPLVANRRLD